MENQHKKKNRSTAHCLVLPFPSQPSIIPMLQFFKRLKDKGLTITLVLPLSFYKTLNKSSCIPFPIETISDGYHDISRLDEGRGLTAYLAKFKQIGPQTLTQLLLKMKKNKKVSPVDCIIYSSVLPWGLNVAKKFALVGAAFFGYSCAVDCIYYNVHQGLLRVPLKRGRDKVMVEGLPVMEYRDMPSPTLEFTCNRHVHFNMFVNQFPNIGAADWLFCNTFYELEKEVVVVMEKQEIGRFRPIGPHIPSKYLDKKLKFDKEYSQLCALKPGSRECIKWLNEKPDGSVVFISVGSKWYDQITELAWGIKGSNKSFLWVVDASEQAMLPDKFVQETSKQGLVVSWCPQVEVLAQTSVGCFVTDCGWNSVLEAKSLGVPMVAMPRQNDRRTNAKYITDVWKTGIEAKPAENEWPRIVRREVVEGCIRVVMKGKRARELKRNAERWRESARKAVDEGGSSDRNIDEFVASLIHS